VLGSEVVTDKRRKVASIKKEKQELDELRKLRKEVDRLKQENDLLKKWQRFLAEEHQPSRVGTPSVPTRIAQASSGSDREKTGAP